MPSIEQPDLSELLATGDDRVLEDILRAYGGPICAALARKYTGILQQADIEDVLSIGLFRVWSNRESFDPAKGTLQAWFYRIVDNAARDVLRHGWQKARQMEVAFEPAALAGLAEPSHNGRPNHDSPSAQDMEIREIIATLPQTQQAIILADAYCRDGTASSRILAEELGMSAATVRVYRKRALDAIRAELERRGRQRPSTEGQSNEPATRTR
jgi:RNA polymerase sigma-70 factor (ECF subfamily)